MTVRVLSIVGEPFQDIPVMFDWPDGEVEQRTNKEGHTGFGMGMGAYYRPDKGESGPHHVWISYVPTDIVRGLGMIGKTNHAHLEPTYQFVRGETEPLPDCEEYISALERIREIVDGVLFK